MAYMVNIYIRNDSGADIPHVQQIDNALCKSERVSYGCQDACISLTNNLSCASCPGRHDGNARRHGFDQHAPEALVI